VRASHWINPIDPAAYRAMTPALLKRLSSAAPTSRASQRPNRAVNPEPAARK
jgi:hypothetical protein